MEYYSFLFLIFVLSAWFIINDESVRKAFVYITDLISIKFRMRVWWLLNNPRNPVVKYMMKRRSEKMAEELLKQFKDNE